MLSAIHNRVNPFFDPRFLDKNQHEILMIRIVDYSVDSEAHRMLLAQAIVELVRDTIGIRLEDKLVYQSIIVIIN